jgi:Fur family transcriptional regulator, iron response regulator
MVLSSLNALDQTSSDDARARDVLAGAGLKATQQRVALTKLLFGRGARHVSAESLYDELVRSGAPGSISCVYNSLRRFSEIGLLKRVPIYGSTAFFDTQLDHHNHFYALGEDRLMDVPAGRIVVRNTPSAPDGYELVSIDVLLRVRRKGAALSA